ncbi:MAG: hypothetical protein ACK5YZ_02475 [bacterium]
MRRGHALRKPKQRQRAQGHPDLLNSSTQQIAPVLLVFWGDPDSEGGASHTSSVP